MLDRRTVERLGAWEDYRLKRVVWPETAGGTVEIHMEPTRKVMRCKSCGRPSRQVHDTTTQRVRDLPIVEHRLAAACGRLLEGMTVQGAARFYGLGWHTVKAIDKARLAACLPPLDWLQIRYLAMDQSALHKGPPLRYRGGRADPCKVLWVGLGRSRATARAFFEQLPEGAAERIEAVAIDMTTPYELEIRAAPPKPRWFTTRSTW